MDVPRSARCERESVACKLPAVSIMINNNNNDEMHSERGRQKEAVNNETE